MIERIRRIFDWKIYHSVGLCKYDENGEFEVDIFEEFFDMFYENVDRLHMFFHSDFYTTEYRFDWLGRKIPLSFSFWDNNLIKPITTTRGSFKSDK